LSNRSQLEKLGSIQRLRILEFIKQSDGTTVTEIAKKFRLSYMGAQGHVRILEKGSLISAKLRKEKVGRPERVFRPTEKGHQLFDDEPMVLLHRTLAAVASIYGANGPEKVLYGLFQKLQEEYKGKVKAADNAGRVTNFCKLREKEGAMPKLTKARSGKTFTLTEYHSPLGTLAIQYPAIHRLEEEMVEKVLRMPVRRSVSESNGGRTVTFEIGAFDK